MCSKIWSHLNSKYGKNNKTRRVSNSGKFYAASIYLYVSFHTGPN